MEATAVRPLETQLAEIRAAEPRGKSSFTYVDLMADVLDTLDDGHLVPYLLNSPHQSVTVLLPDLPLQYAARNQVFSGDRLRIRWPRAPGQKTVLEVGAHVNGNSPTWSPPLAASSLKRDLFSIGSLNTPEELASGFADLIDELIQILDDQMELEAKLWMENRAIDR